MSSADNIPDRLGLFYNIRGDDLPKIEIVDKSKIDLCHDFIVRREDHTVGNLVRNRILMDPRVVFAAYKHPHPLETEIHFRVRTVNQPPLKSFETALGIIRKEFCTFREEFCKCTGYNDRYEANISASGEGPAGAYDTFGENYGNEAGFDDWGNNDQGYDNNNYNSNNFNYDDQNYTADW